MKISLVYLGKQGGGALFTENAYRFGREAGLVNCAFLSNQNELLSQYENFSLISTAPIAHNLKNLALVPFLSLIQVYKSIRWALKTREDLILFVMPSPFDLVTMLIIKVVNRKIVFICHETSSHQGERWPTKGAINLRAHLAKLIISLSPGETLKLSKIFPSGKIHELWHPIFNVLKFEKPSEIEQGFLGPPVFLFIGRLKAYKGIDRLIKAWDKTISGSLVIAGDGKFSHELPENTLLINRWLSEGEIAYLIEKADVVIFPYTSASQSGLIPFARNKGKTIIASRLTGFVQQLAGYSNQTIWIDGQDTLSLRLALQDFSNRTTSSEDFQEKTQEDGSMVAFLGRIRETWLLKQTI